METLLELNLGYVNCDICGEGYNGIGVWFDPNADRDKPFRFIRNSKCYGNIDVNGLSKEDLLAQLDAAAFMVATRYARRQFRDFVRQVRNDKIKVLQDDPTAVAPAVVTWDPEPMLDQYLAEIDDDDDDDPEPSDQCDPECTVCYPERMEGQVRMYLAPADLDMDLTAPRWSDLMQFSVVDRNFRIVDGGSVA